MTTTNININTLLSPPLTLCRCAGITSKKQLLEKLSALASQYSGTVSKQTILDALRQREKISHTYMGHGVAIPHCRVAELQKPICILLTLPEAVQFGDDHQQADIIACLIVPAEKNDLHVKMLAALAEQLQHAHYRQALRAAQSQTELYYVPTHELTVPA